MARIVSLSFPSGGHTYTFSLEWGTDALMEGAIALPITVTSKSKGGAEVSLKAEVGLSRDEKVGGLLYIKVAGETVFEEPVDAQSAVERILEKIPGHVFAGGDPLTGCLMRAGITVAIGQILECNEVSREYPWYGQRAVAIGKCLWTHIPNMSLKAGFRAGTCLIRAGF